ncbi:MAG: alpha/beta hydrolase [Alphaproteobacteria bacterium]|jgi:acetyl esterase|nr:alpha/beta hydrolase [Alphaproteobacteria bacterium]
MPLDPQIQEALAAMAKLDLPAMETLAPEAARTQMEDLVKARGLEPEPVGGVEELLLPGPGGGIPARLYRPIRGADAPLPVLIYYHGGGHVIGSLDTHDGVARALSNHGECAVLSVNYRKAPEHVFPAAVEDAFAAAQWAGEKGGEVGLDTGRIAVGGDSAGGNLAAVVALMARDAGAPRLALQVLVYPIADYACVAGSYRTYGKGYGPLTEELMFYFQRYYLDDAKDVGDWRASPIKAASHAGLAPALIVAAEYDVLHDDAVAYAETLRGAGVPVTYSEYPGMIHAFFSMPSKIDGTARAQAEVGAALRQAFG